VIVAASPVKRQKGLGTWRRAAAAAAAAAAAVPHPVVAQRGTETADAG